MERIEKGLLASNSDFQRDLLRSAARAALTAGAIIRELYEKPHDIKMKGVIDLVTEADLAAEAVIIASLQEDFPEISFLAEESANDIQAQKDKQFWIIDPLDGTTNFAHGLPIFGVSIALWDQDCCRAGVVYCPMQDELFWATKGGGAWVNERQIQVTNTDMLIQALVATGFPYDIHKHLDDIIDQLQNILPKVRDIRRCGAAAVDLAYLACGRVDGFWELDLKPWDTAAGMLLVTEAGGKVSDFAGKQYNPFIPEIVASNSLLHQKIVALLEWV